MTRAAAAVIGIAAVAFMLLGSGRLEPPSPDAFPVRGIDVSHHQGPIDWGRVADAGIEFAYIKATEGRDFRDPRFEANWAAAGTAGIARGAYHFFTFCSDGRAQAEHFLRVAPPASGALIPVADVEFVGNCMGWGDLGAVRARLGAFLERVQRAWGVPPILYVTPDAHRRVLAGQFRSHPVWLRSVEETPAVDAFGGWLVWQFSETGAVPGIRGPVDLNTLRPGVTVRALRTPATPQ
ncbi:MAG: GH25 family lysozyme [Myxococcota bacterium]